MIGKFGANSKLSTTITIDSSDFGQKMTASGLSGEMRQLVRNCLPKEVLDQIQDETEQKSGADLSEIVDTSHDLCLILEDGLSFRVHKAFVAERCEYFDTFLRDPFHEAIEHSNHANKKRSVSELHLKQISAEILTEIIFFLYSNEFSRTKVHI